MGRLPANVEFLRKLKEILAIQSDSEFSRMCGKQMSNMNKYLNDRMTPGHNVLEDCLLNATNSVLFNQSIEPLEEIERIPDKKTNLPESGGVYILYDSAGNVLYIGQGENFKAEIRQTLRREVPTGMRLGSAMKKFKPTIGDLATYMSLYKIDNSLLRHNVEAFLLRVFINQTHNSKIGHFKGMN